MALFDLRIKLDLSTPVLSALPKVNSFKLLVLHLVSLFCSLDIDLDLNHNILRECFKQHSSLVLFLKLLQPIISFVSRIPSVKHHIAAELLCLLAITEFSATPVKPCTGTSALFTCQWTHLYCITVRSEWSCLAWKLLILLMATIVLVNIGK